MTPVEPVAEPEDASGSINSLVARYVDLKGEKDQESQNERFILFEGIWNHPYGNSTVGRSLMKASRANPERVGMSTEDRENECRHFLEKLLDRAEKGKPFFGFLAANMRHLKSPDVTWMDRIYPKFLPYMEAFYGRGDEDLVDDDIRELGAPNIVVWEAYRRNEWNNYKTEDGKDRIQKAIEKMDSLVNGEIEKEVAQIQDPQQKQAREKELRSMYPSVETRGKFKAISTFLEERGVAPTWRDSKSPDWLTGEMIDPSRHALGPRQVVKYLRHFDASRTPGSAPAFEKEAPPIFMKDKPKNPLDELSKQIKETIDVADKMLPSDPNVHDQQREERVKNIKEKVKHRVMFLDPNNPDRLRQVMEFLRDEYEDDDPKYAIASAFVDIGPIDPGGNKSRETMSRIRKKLMENITELIKSPMFQKPMKDETFGLTPAQRFDIYLEDFFKDVTRFIMDNKIWKDLVSQIGAVAYAIREIIRTAVFFARMMKRG